MKHAPIHVWLHFVVFIFFYDFSLLLLSCFSAFSYRRLAIIVVAIRYASLSVPIWIMFALHEAIISARSADVRDFDGVASATIIAPSRSFT